MGDILNRVNDRVNSPNKIQIVTSPKQRRNPIHIGEQCNMTGQAIFKSHPHATRYASELIKKGKPQSNIKAFHCGYCKRWHLTIT